MLRSWTVRAWLENAVIMLAYLIFAITAIVVLLAAITYLYPVSKRIKINLTFFSVIFDHKSIPLSLADLGGGREGRTPPPWASKFFRFHAVFGKIWRVHAPPGGFTPPPRENPGSATVC